MTSIDQGVSEDAAAQFVPLQGAPNCRDLGGYRTAEGATVRYGQLYRSGHLSALTEDDHKVFATLGIQLVFDLRSKAEVEESPSNFPDWAPVRTENLPVWPHAETEVERRVRNGNVWTPAEAQQISEAEGEEIMCRFYRSFIVDHQRNWSRLLQLLAEPDNWPALIHCAGGKDRTGTAAAIILMTLGVSRETVILEYTLSNHMVRHWIEQAGHGEPPASILSLMESRPNYIESALDTATELYGSFDEFLEIGLGIDTAIRGRLKAAFLV